MWGEAHDVTSVAGGDGAVDEEGAGKEGAADEEGIGEDGGASEISMVIMVPAP